MGFKELKKKTSEQKAKFSVLQGVFLGRVLQSSHHIHKLCHTPLPHHTLPRPPPHRTRAFITAQQRVVYNAIIKNKELGPSTFALTWRDWTHSVVNETKASFRVVSIGRSAKRHKSRGCLFCSLL